MSRQIDDNKPYSDEDKEWLHSMSLDWKIAENERRFPTVKDADYEDGGSVDTSKVLEGAGIDVPPVHTGNPVVQQVFTQGPDGVHDRRDHPLTGTVDDGDSDGDGDGDDDGDEPVALEDLTVEELKEELHKRELPVGGNKSELQKRLSDALDAESPEA